MPKHYTTTEITTLAELQELFPEPVADELNFVLFSTSGVHGSYATIEEVEADPDLGGQVTVLVAHPRMASLRYGNVEVTPESAPYLKALRASSLQAVSRIGLPESVD